MFNFLVIPYLTFAARLHGGGYVQNVNRQLRNAIFAFPYLLFGPIAFATAFIGINAGHDDFWEMGTGPNEQKNNWLTMIVSWAKLKRDSLAWCWVGMGIKGLLIGLGTLNPYIIIGHAVLFPLAYHIGQRTKRGNETAEPLSGFLLGVNLFANLHLCAIVCT